MDSQSIQTALVMVIVAAAVLFVAARLYRTFAAARKKDAGCAGGCGCSTTKSG